MARLGSQKNLQPACCQEGARPHKKKKRKYLKFRGKFQFFHRNLLQTWSITTTRKYSLFWCCLQHLCVFIIPKIFGCNWTSVFVSYSGSISRFGDFLQPHWKMSFTKILAVFNLLVFFLFLQTFFLLKVYVHFEYFAICNVRSDNPNPGKVRDHQQIIFVSVSRFHLSVKWNPHPIFIMENIKLDWIPTKIEWNMHVFIHKIKWN